MKLNYFDLKFDKDRQPMLVASPCTAKIDCRFRLDSPEKVYDAVKELGWERNVEEYAYIISLNSRLHPTGIFEISHGSGDAAVVDQKAIFTRLLLVNASAFLMFHNHPSGENEPSDIDKKITNVLADAGDMLNIPLIDHMILTDGNENVCGEWYYSFAENGLIRRKK